MTNVELWHFQASHFCEKVRWALDFKRIPHVRRALGASYLIRAWRRTGSVTLPVLLLDGQAIGDSTRIIEALESYQQTPSLYPSDAKNRDRALALEDYFDEELGHQTRAAAMLGPLIDDPRWAARFASRGLPASTRGAMEAVAPAFAAFYRWRHQITPESSAVGHAKTQEAFDRLQAEIGPSGYLVGDSFSVADLTAASLMGIAFGVSESGDPLPQPVPQSIQELRASVADHPTRAWVVEMYRRHRGNSAEIVFS